MNDPLATTVTEAYDLGFSSASPPDDVSWGDDVRAWARAIDGFTSWSRAAGHAPRTIRQRRYQLAFLAEANLRRNPWKLSTEQLAEWLGSYEWAPATRYSYRATVRMFYAYGVIAGRIKRSPAAALPAVRVPQAIPRPTPDAVVERALKNADHRARLLILLATHAGLRRAEIAALPWDRIGSDELRITGKGGKTRAVPLHSLLGDELAAERARRERGEYGDGFRYRPTTDGGWVFPSRKRGHVNPETIGIALSRLLGENWSGHTLRHRFGTRSYQISRDIRITAALLGHARLDTSAGYARIPDDALRAVIDAL